MVDFVREHFLGTRLEFCNQYANPIANGQAADSTKADVRLMKRRAHVLHHKLQVGAPLRTDSAAAPEISCGGGLRGLCALTPALLSHTSPTPTRALCSAGTPACSPRTCRPRQRQCSMSASHHCRSSCTPPTCAISTPATAACRQVGPSLLPADHHTHLLWITKAGWALGSSPLGSSPLCSLPALLGAVTDRATDCCCCCSVAPIDAHVNGRPASYRRAVQGVPVHAASLEPPACATRR